MNQLDPVVSAGSNHGGAAAHVQNRREGLRSHYQGQLSKLEDQARKALAESEGNPVQQKEIRERFSARKDNLLESADADRDRLHEAVDQRKGHRLSVTA